MLIKTNFATGLICPNGCMGASIYISSVQHRSDGRFWAVDLCCAVVRRKSAILRLASMRSDTILPQ
jgi:hypothetical protein